MWLILDVDSNISIPTSIGLVSDLKLPLDYIEQVGQWIEHTTWDLIESTEILIQNSVLKRVGRWFEATIASSLVYKCSISDLKSFPDLVGSIDIGFEFIDRVDGSAV